jgi:hypothetical protein
MTAQDAARGPIGRDHSPWKAVGVFLALTVCLSAIFWVLINATQTAYPLYVVGLMWMPGLSAILTCRILRRPLSRLGFRWNGRYALIGYLIPIRDGIRTGLVRHRVLRHPDRHGWHGASHNLWMQSILTPLTTENEYTKWIAATWVWRSWSWRPSWRSCSGPSAQTCPITGWAPAVGRKWLPNSRFSVGRVYPGRRRRLTLWITSASPRRNCQHEAWGERPKLI